MELFVAIRIRQEHAKELERFTRNSFIGAPAEQAADMHITLQYIGHTTKVNEICESLADVVSPPFSLTFGGVGVFSRPKDTDVIWQGIDGDFLGLKHLYEQIHSVLSVYSKGDVRTYTPHISLSFSPNVADAQTICNMHSPIEGKSFVVESYELCCVLPGTTGCRFRTIAEYKLSEDSTRKKVRLLCINDFHAALEPSSAGLGAAKLATAVQNYVQEHNDTRVLFGGDNFFGNPISELYEGKPVLDLMESLKVCASVAGNHDFDFPVEQFVSWQQNSGIPMLSANLFRADGTLCEFVKPSLSITIDDIRIGVIGVSMKEPMHSPDRPFEWSEYLLADPIDAAKDTYDELAEKNLNAIIALTHLGLSETRDGGLQGDEALRLPQALPMLDGFFAAHFHRFLQLTINGVAVAEGGGTGQGFSVLALTFNQSKQLLSCVPLAYNLMDERDNIVPDDDINEKMSNYHVSAMEKMGETVAVAACDIKHLEAGTRRISLCGTPLTKLATEVMQQATGCPIALLYAGRMGEGFRVGEISLHQFYQVFNFANTIVTARMNGAKLRKNIELGMRSLPDDGASPLAIGGLSVTINPNQPVGSRVISICLPDGSSIKDDAIYDIVIEDYLASDPLGLVFSDAEMLTYHDMTLRKLMLDKFRQLSIIQGDNPTNIRVRNGV